jgi:hypothetical protein
MLISRYAVVPDAADITIDVADIKTRAISRSAASWGSMGMTDELNVGHYFKRITSINVQFGHPSFHLTRYARREKPVHT